MLETEWERLDHIGDGEYATIFKVAKVGQAKVYAAKMAKPVYGNVIKHAQHYDALDNEIAMLKQLKHPNIIKLITAGKTDTPNSSILKILQVSNLVWTGQMDPIYVMEYCKGKSLFIQSKRASYSETEIQNIARQMASALSYLKSKNIIHCDIKLANILCCNNGKYRLADFGFARMAPSRPNGYVGTPYYMAPEIWDYETLSFGVDSWGLGVALYILLFGRPPFDGCSKAEIKPKIKAGILNYPPQSTVSDAARDLLEKIFVPDQNARIAIEDVLTHPWLNSKSVEDVSIDLE